MNAKFDVTVAVIGGGPAGLMAAEVLSKSGIEVHLFDSMPSVGRKFLLAGKGGLNLTHSEGAELFASRFNTNRLQIDALLAEFGPTDLRNWAETLGVQTFVGTSGRVFPKDMKAAPLLRAWIHRLRHPTLDGAAVQFHVRHRWIGLVGNDPKDSHSLCFETPQGRKQVTASVVILALGGGSWARLGSDGSWTQILSQRGVAMAPLLPSNCGFEVQNGWSQHFVEKFAGQPFKSVSISFSDSKGNSFSRKGEFVATSTGVEGSLVYAASALLRDEILFRGSATFTLDLVPDLTHEKVIAEVRHPRGSRSLSNHLKSRLNLDGIKSGILRELLSKEEMNDPGRLAAGIKAVPITLKATRPIDEAISSAGGVLFEAMTPELMLKHIPGVFCAGEMIDWEAPTGGYLLTACISTGRKAGTGASEYLKNIGLLQAET